MANLRLWQCLTVLLLLTSIGLLIGVIILAVDKQENDKSSKANSYQQQQQQQQTSCTDDEKSVPEPPGDDKSNKVFSKLTAKEYGKVTTYLLAQVDLHLTETSKATLISNYIYTIESHLSKKSDILGYLDEGQAMPSREAMVTIYMGAENPPVVKEYIVKPVDNPTSHELYQSPIRSSSISWNTRYMDAVETSHIAPLIDDVTKRVDFILKESYNYTFHNCGNQCLMGVWPLPMAQSAGERRNWLAAFRKESPLTEGYHLHQMPFFIEFASSGNDPTKFKITKVIYNNKLFPDVDSLIQKYKNDNSFREKVPMPLGGSRYGSPERRNGGAFDPSSELPPPEQYQPNGRRFTVTGNKVTYLGWSFNIRVPRTSGVQVLNVKFHGKRIAYEVSAQDIAALYGGLPPTGIFMQFFDTSWQLGVQLFPLIKGVDCPRNAIYLDNLFYDSTSSTTVHRKDVVCVFELNTGTPLRRHFSSDFMGPDPTKYHFSFSMPDTVLVVRFMNTVINYDYVFDYIFHQNGVIDAKVSPTGYMFMSPLYNKDPWTNKYGTSINPRLLMQAPIHHHLFSFKFDIDVMGTRNRFETLDITPKSHDHPYVPGVKYTMNTFERKLKSTEMDALVQYDFNKPKYYVMYNNRKTHRNGYKHGYRIAAQGFSKLLLPEDSAPANATHWARNQVVITKYSDFEQTSASKFRQFDVHEPAVSFKSFYDNNENIVDEDLVAWVSVGLQHIPSAEDVPVTTTPGKTLTVSIQPYNYFDEDPSFISRDGVVVRRNGNDLSAKVTSYFTKKKQCMTKNTKVDIQL